MRILFIIPPVTEKIWSNHYHEIYLGLAYLARIAHDKGHHIKVIDCDAKNIAPSELTKEIKEYRPEMVGLTALYGSLENALRISRITKSSCDAKVFMGGLPASFIPDVLLKYKSIDFLIRGEAEETFKLLLDDPGNLDIDGISYRKAGRIIHNKNREFIKDLDSLGLPLRRIFPLRKYKIRFKLHNSTAIETARGCPYGCDFCTQKPKEGAKLRLRSPDMVLKELRHIAIRYPFIKRIMFVDNDFLTNSNHSTEILKRIISRRLNKRFHFMIATRVSNISRGGDCLLRLLKKANVTTIFFGIESVSAKYRDKIGKITDEQYTIDIFRRLEQLEIDPLPSYVIGYPNEEKKDIDETLRFAQKLNTKVFSFNILTPYPGTPFFEYCKKAGLIKGSAWNKYDNAHKVFMHKLNLEKELLRVHRQYILRKDYLSKIRVQKIHKNSQYGRMAMFIYYIIFMELATKLRSIRRILSKKNTFIV